MLNNIHQGLFRNYQHTCTRPYAQHASVHGLCHGWSGKCNTVILSHLIKCKLLEQRDTDFGIVSNWDDFPSVYEARMVGFGEIVIKWSTSKLRTNRLQNYCRLSYADTGKSYYEAWNYTHDLRALSFFTVLGIQRNESPDSLVSIGHIHQYEFPFISMADCNTAVTPVP